MVKKLLVIGWIITIASLFLYSFTQVDLGLTLSRISIWQGAQKFFQHIGYFDRPLSAFLYSLILVLLFSFYYLFLRLARKGQVSKKSVIVLSLVTGTILLFAYNAFSYDLFNYIFDAKIVTYYHKNPYEFKALDFPSDPMLSFMHWTHRTLPYGPSWLGFTLPLSYLGFQFFLPTFFLFKALAAVSYIGSVFLVSRISKITKKEDQVFNTVFFALNPLIIIEGLVSGHNDILVVFLSLLSIYLILSKKYVRSFFFLILSAGVKYSTLFLLPVYLLFFFKRFKKNENLNYDTFFLLSLIFMIIPVILASFRTNFQPWYLLNIIPFACFLGKKYYISIPIFIISFFSLLQYLPFLYLGNWDKPVPQILFWLTLTSVALSVLFVVSLTLKARLNIKD